MLIKFLLCTGTTFRGKVSFSTQNWKRSSDGLQIVDPHTCNIGILIILWPWGLVGSRFWNIFKVSQFVKLMSESNWFVFVDEFKWVWLAFSNILFWFEKMILNISVPFKSVNNLFSWNIGVIQGTFLPFKNVINIDQYVFELALGSIIRINKKKNFLLHY